MAKRKYTADEALELIFADNGSAEDFGSSSEDDVSSENENILEQSDQYCNNSVNLLDKESINDCGDCGVIRTNENISQKCDDNIVEFDSSSDSSDEETLDEQVCNNNATEFDVQNPKMCFIYCQIGNTGIFFYFYVVAR